MSLPRIEARKRGANREACHKRMEVLRLPRFFWLLIARV